MDTIRKPAIRKVGVIRKNKINLDLAQKAASVLGYTLAEECFKEEEGRRELAGILSKLNISVLNPSSVERYKRQKIEEAKKNVNHRRNSGYRTTFSWLVIALEKYRKAVPLSVIETAVRIKEEVPTVEFFVEELRKKVAFTSPKVVGDPFLFVKLGAGKYYLAQWDEPGFEDEQ